MEDKILEVIRASIPEKEMGIVKVVFEERDRFKVESENGKERIKTLEGQLKTALEELNELRKTKNENQNKQFELAKKEDDIKGREIKLDTVLAQKEAQVIRECFDKVMKVPMVRKNIYKNVAKNSYDGGGSENGSEDITEE
jgi:DNA invertase Pin-like site-specific DNA recombinase